MGSQQQFCLRWNNHQTNLLSVFEQLLQSESFVDVTLACEGLSLRAHKVVLSACSPYFQTLFVENPCKHPIVILKDIPYTELKALIEFMYKGEVNVSQDRLSTLLKTAEYLKIKGLSEVSQNHNEGDSETTMTKSKQRLQLHLDGQRASSLTPPPQSTHSPPSKRKRLHQRRPSDSVSGTSDIEECEVPNLKGSPEVLESRVEFPQNVEDRQICPPIHPQDEVLALSNSPQDAKEHIMTRSPQQEDTSQPSDPGGSGLYQSTGPSTNLMPPLQNAPSTSQPSQDAGEDIKEPIIEIEEISPQDDDGGDEKRWGPTWTPEDMANALQAVRQGKMSLSKAAATFHIPGTTLWQRAKKEGIDTTKRDCNFGSSWTEEILSQALSAIRSGRLSINKASVTYGIPNTTLWQRSRKEGIDTSRTSSASAHPSNWTEDTLAQALEAVRLGRMSVNKASSVYGIPSTTLWSRAKRHGIETARRNNWDQDRDEILLQALQAVRGGQVSMTQASIQFNVPYTTLWKHFKKWEYNESVSGIVIRKVTQALNEQNQNRVAL